MSTRDSFDSGYPTRAWGRRQAREQGYHRIASNQLPGIIASRRKAQIICIDKTKSSEMMDASPVFMLDNTDGHWQLRDFDEEYPTGGGHTFDFKTADEVNLTVTQRVMAETEGYELWIKYLNEKGSGSTVYRPGAKPRSRRGYLKADSALGGIR